MFGLALIIGSPLLGFLANRLGRKRVLLGSSVVVSLVFALFGLMPDKVPPMGLYAVLFILFMTGTAGGQILAAASKELFHPAISGVSVGTVNAFPFIAGGILQVVMGAILDRGGLVDGTYTMTAYRQVFALCFGCAIFSLVAGLFIKETWPSPATRPAVLKQTGMAS